MKVFEVLATCFSHRNAALVLIIFAPKLLCCTVWPLLVTPKITQIFIFLAFGHLITFGSNKYGQLGLGDFKAHDVPSVVSGSLLGQRVANVSCGDGFTVIATHGEYRHDLSTFDLSLLPLPIPSFPSTCRFSHPLMLCFMAFFSLLLLYPSLCFSKICFT